MRHQRRHDTGHADRSGDREDLVSRLDRLRGHRRVESYFRSESDVGAVNLLRAVSFAFALSLATALLVLPLLSAAGRTMDGSIVNGIVAVAVAVGILAADADVENAEIWTFSGIAFLVGVHLLGETGANAGDASATVVVGVRYSRS